MTAEDGFGTVAIVGVGLIGGSLGMALRRRGLARRVIGIGRSVGRLDKAARMGAIDEYVVDLAKGCCDADIIVMCTPVSAIIADLPAVLDAAGSEAVITDVGSVKSAIVDAAGDDPRFVGSHPMAGSEATGVEAARETLFDEATWIVAPSPATSSYAAATARDLGLAVGSSVYTLSPDAHDRAVAVVSHLPHVMATSLMLYAQRRHEDAPTLAAMSAGSFADATRVAASSPEIWRDVCLTNKDAVIAAIDGFLNQMQQARAVIDRANAEELYAMFEAGADAKGKWRRR